MRSQFKGHFREPQAIIDELWKDATFVFDANVLLNLYRYSDKSRKEFLKLLNTIQKRCWLPEQCVHEYLSNRLSVIRDQMKAYSDTAKSIGSIKETFAGSKGHPFISEKNFDALSSVIGKIDKELDKNRNSQEARISQDEVKEQPADIFEGRVGPGFDDADLDKMFVDGEARYGEEIPPGYKDANKFPNAKRRSEKRSNFGDYILWRQTLEMAKAEGKSVILVTDDQKED
ncbi:PIN domain-containing protein [Leisingera aquaemixtae]|uniref:PIN domain-containing protein n=1 Tax=Leisingera aquaemixtae TaxID=1396826 RepID=A0ABY5WF30_9RHOB|nr:PIN domain-containing protein [Leisingera aquaemixtae]UWQ40054.1 PIN domain-containing protein [Leisingera aquaemixtae]